MSIVDRIESDFRNKLAGELSSIDVPEWGENGTPLKIYWKPLLNFKSQGKIFALQSNNNKNVKWLHINCVETSDELIGQSGLTEILFQGAIPLYGYKRIMVIGR